MPRAAPPTCAAVVGAACSTRAIRCAGSGVCSATSIASNSWSIASSFAAVPMRASGPPVGRASGQRRGRGHPRRSVRLQRLEAMKHPRLGRGRKAELGAETGLHRRQQLRAGRRAGGHIDGGDQRRLPERLRERVFTGGRGARDELAEAPERLGVAPAVRREAAEQLHRRVARERGRGVGEADRIDAIEVSRGGRTARHRHVEARRLRRRPQVRDRRIHLGEPSHDLSERGGGLRVGRAARLQPFHRGGRRFLGGPSGDGLDVLEQPASRPRPRPRHRCPAGRATRRDRRRSAGRRVRARAPASPRRSRRPRPGSRAASSRPLRGSRPSHRRASA